MKEIRIIQKSGKDIILFDEDDTNLLEYTKEVQKIMESNRIIILSTSISNAIIRPSQIDAIVVNESSIYDSESIQNQKMEETQTITINNNEDIISD